MEGKFLNTISQSLLLYAERQENIVVYSAGLIWDILNEMEWGHHDEGNKHRNLAGLISVPG